MIYRTMGQTSNDGKRKKMKKWQRRKFVLNLNFDISQKASWKGKKIAIKTIDSIFVVIFYWRVMVEGVEKIDKSLLWCMNLSFGMTCQNFYWRILHFSLKRHDMNKILRFKF